MDKFKDIASDALATLLTEREAAFRTLIEMETPTVDQVNEAEALAVEIDEIVAEQDQRETAATEAAEKFAALRERKFGKKVADHEAAEEADSPEDGERIEDPNAPAEVEGEPEDAEREADEEAKRNAPGAPQSTARGASVVTLARRTRRPAVPQTPAATVSITAAADVPEFPTGSSMEGIEQIAQAVINRSRGFTPPNGDGKSENLQKFGVASFRRPFEKDLTIERGVDDMEVLDRASKESRLPGNSLVAAGGWCSPSETMYDLCSEGETLEGLYSLPEVNVKRGGINYTRGPDFSTFYGTANGFFIQTEAQAIAGATKPCVTVDCPAFQEVRLDAVGLCIKIPILTNATWPELIQRYTSGFLTAYQHRLSANTLSRVLALTPAARVITGLGSTTIDTIAALTLIADQRREKYRMSMSQSMEVILPFWVKNAMIADMQARSGNGNDAVNEAAVNALFAAHKFNVQYVYNWQPLPVTDNPAGGVNEANIYPATFNALMYPAGTFVKGTQDVINLSTVYDAASLAVNTYTGLFMEEGILVAKMCNDADLVTLPVCNAGRTGASNLTCA